MDAGLEQSLVLVLAPAGFGKSTLLSEWAAEKGSNVAWLSIDEADNDFKRFFSYLIFAVQQVNETLGQDVLPVLQASDYPQTEHLLTILINELAEDDEDIVLVLDDYHLIHNQGIHEIVQFLIEYAPPNLHLIIASRVTPPVPLTRLRARGQVAEIRSHDLRFNNEEARAYLNHHMGLDLSSEDVASLQRRTEGWITGLHLAALTMKDRDDKHAFVTHFSGSHHYIIDYLVSEVLSRQPEGTQTFLTQTSILDRFCAPLCDAVTNGSDSEESILHLQSTHLFLIPLDDERNWYRYHHLFADFLNQRLTEREPQLVPELHRRASTWLVENGLVPEAVSHSLAGEDFEAAAEMIEHIGPEMMMSNEFDQLSRWLKVMPETIVENWPWLCIIWAWMYDRWGQFENGERYLRHAERALDQVSTVVSQDEERIVRGQISAIRALYAIKRADIERSIEYSRQALGFLPDGYFNRGVASFSLGWARMLLGDLSGALEALDEGYDASVEANNRMLAQVIVFEMGNIQFLQGHLHRAVEKYREAIEYRYGKGQIRMPYASSASMNLALILLEWNKVDEALVHLGEGFEIGVASKVVDAVAIGHATNVMVQLARGDHESAKEACDQAERMRGEIPNLEPITLTRTLKSRVRCLLAKGDLNEALQAVRDSGLTIEDEIEYFSEFRQMILARVLIRSGRENSSVQDLADAHTVLQKILAKTGQAGFTHHRIEALILQALAFEAEEEHDQAVASLAEALELAEPEGYLRIFLDEGERMRTLLRQVDLHGKARTYVQELLAAFDADQGEGRRSPTQQLSEPLSKRELEVLRMLQSDLTGPEIAQELVISLNTLRTHTKNIYAKLVVNNRRAAVGKAREIDLI
jgi:LuxR family maltose regulon positive regulatory protein